jgi:hypothetical protein
MTENKFELQSYFILYLLFVRILNLSKDIVSILHISNFLPILMSWMAISENNSSSAELNAKSLETQIISQKYEQNIVKITKR